MADNQAEIVKVADPLPEFVSETDLLKIELGQEKAQKFAAQKDSLTLQLNNVTAEFEKAKQALDMLVGDLSAKYKVSGQDSYDKTTGKITRRTAVP